MRDKYFQVIIGGLIAADEPVSPVSGLSVADTQPHTIVVGVSGIYRRIAAITTSSM